MDPFQQQKCTELIEKLEKKPMFSIVNNENWKCFIENLTFEKIKEKFESKKYISSFDLYLDLKLLLETDNDKLNPNLNYVLEDLSQWIDKKIHNMPTSEVEEDYMKVNKYIQKILYLCKALNVSSTKSSRQISNLDLLLNKKSGVLNRDTSGNSQKIKKIQGAIDNVQKPEELQSILKILQKHIPNLVLTKELVIDGRMISKQCCAELIELLKRISPTSFQ